MVDWKIKDLNLVGGRAKVVRGWRCVAAVWKADKLNVMSSEQRKV